MEPLTAAATKLIEQGGFAVLALVMFIAYRKDIKTTAEVLIQVVRENTASNVELRAEIRAWHERSGDDERRRAPRERER